MVQLVLCHLFLCHYFLTQEKMTQYLTVTVCSPALPMTLAALDTLHKKGGPETGPPFRVKE
jgi:hypothetical protein